MASNGIDEKNAIVNDDDNKPQEHDKNERNRLNSRNYYKRNKELILVKKKIYNDKNKEQIKEYRKNY